MKPRAKPKKAKTTVVLGKPVVSTDEQFQKQLQALCQVIDGERAKIDQMVVPTAYDKVDAYNAILLARDEIGEQP